MCKSLGKSDEYIKESGEQERMRDNESSTPCPDLRAEDTMFAAMIQI
jgi:hypothetical protein